MPGGVGGVGGAGGPGGQNIGAGSPVIGGGGVAASTAGGAAGSNAGGVAGGAAAGATRNTNLSALQEIEEAYNKRLDMDVSQLMESFGDIIKTASVSLFCLCFLSFPTRRHVSFTMFYIIFARLFLARTYVRRRGMKKKEGKEK